MAHLQFEIIETIEEDDSIPSELREKYIKHFEKAAKTIDFDKYMECCAYHKLLCLTGLNPDKDIKFIEGHLCIRKTLAWITPILFKRLEYIQHQLILDCIDPAHSTKH